MRSSATRFVFDFDEGRPSGDVLSASDAALLLAMVTARDRAHTEEVSRLTARVGVLEGALAEAANLIDAHIAPQPLRCGHCGGENYCGGEFCNAGNLSKRLRALVGTVGEEKL